MKQLCKIIVMSTNSEEVETEDKKLKIAPTSSSVSSVHSSSNLPPSSAADIGRRRDS